VRGDGVGAPWFGILGPLLVVGKSGAVRIGSHLQRLLLAVLLVDANRTVSADRLADELWSDHLPDDPGGALRTQVSRLRKALPEGTPLVRDESGYRLAADPNDLDAGRFEQLLEAAAGARGARALRLVDGALQLWRGAPLEEFIDRPFALIEARRLQELHGAAREQRAALLLATGRPVEAAAEAAAMLAERPEREGARALLMEALYLQGRHTDALEVYQRWRRRLAEEHGLEPSPALRRIEQRVLQHTMVESDASPPGPVPAVPVPRPVSSFIGRDTDVRSVADLLGRTRLVTLWGPGGVGKTRLALEVGAQAAGRYLGGVHVCDLTVLAPGGDVARAVANVVGLQERSGRRLEAQLVDRLGGRRALVILDNCEHVLAGAASLARRLTQSTSQVDVLATSRERLGVDAERLGVDAEHLWEVAPLATGGSNSPAVVLFLDRARATKASFEASPDGLDTIADVCRRLDGLPLAVELAAARVRGLAPEDLLRALDRRFEILTGGSGRPSRHRSLRAVIGWSYTQLQPIEQRVFDRLSVFRGPFDLDAATAVGSDDDVGRAAVVPAVLRLLDCALLVEEPGSGRYSMLDTVRHYGLERLTFEGALDQARDRHARWALAEAERAARGLGTDAEPEWATTIEGRLDELRAAHAWLVGHDVERALRLSSALRPYALWRGHSEIFRWAEVAAAAASGTRSALLPEVLLAASTGAWQRGDLESAAAAALAARDAARGLGTATARATIEASADVALVTGNLDRAAAEFTEAYELATAAGDLLQAVWDLGSAALAVAYGGDTERALEISGEVFSTAERSGSPSGKAFAHFVAGEILAGTQPERAEADLRHAIDLATAADGRFIVGLAEVALAASRVRQQDAATALTFCESAIRHWREGGAWTPLGVTLRTVIALLMRVGAFDDAVMLYGTTEAPGAGPPLFGADASMMQDAAERLRGYFGDEEFHRRVDAGRSMAPDGATGFALEALSRASRRLSAV
jgi:predicted ATPase/DNA-binding SARP family transcriptional activator